MNRHIRPQILPLILPTAVELGNAVLVNVWDPLTDRMRRELRVRALKLRYFECFASHNCIRDN